MWTRLRTALEPMNVAAYVAWAAIGMEVWNVPPRAAAWVPDGLAWPLVITGHALFLVLFLARSLQLTAHHGVLERVVVAGQLLIGLGLLATAHYSAMPVLLIIAMAQVAQQYPPAVLAAIFVAVNLAQYAVMSSLWRMSAPGLVAVIHASFQLFAMMTSWYAVTAERSRDALAQAHADLLATRSLLAESVRDSERLRLSRELHDVAGHKLTALKLNLAALLRDPRFAQVDAVALCARLADELLADIRGVVQQMRLHDGVDLRNAVHALAAPFPTPKVHLDLAEDARVVDVAQAEAVLRTVQEGLTNAARHSGAGNVWIGLHRAGDRIALEIRDDGRGGAGLRAGNGLTGMRERLQALGGDLRIDAGPEGGVRLAADLPVAA
jgi:signal transduction histidine kinase